MPIDSLPVSPNQVDSDAMRTKINELISDNSSVTVGDTPPASPGEGDLWFDEGAASMYVYIASPTNAWIQANPAGGGSGSGPRAYVAFDGTAADMATELAGANSLNVSSITDHGPGDYTINYTSPVSQPIISIGYQIRASSPFHALYWGVLAQTATSARIAIGSNNVYYDHPYVSFIAH